MKIAIQGHPTRGKEVIQILESLGGKNTDKLEGTYKTFYYIDDKNEIGDDHMRNFPLTYTFYTLESFEKEFPFKVGDEVMFPVTKGWLSGKIIGLDYAEDQLKYKIHNKIGGYSYIKPHQLSLYPMKKERNITLTLDKAREWYKKGGELKEIALQAFTEKELNPLPRSWEEFCEKFLVKKGECILEEAHLAMIQLKQLRDYWRQGWKPTAYDTGYLIVYYPNNYVVTAFSFIGFLSFPTKEMAEEFLKCFRDLIEKAGDLI